MAADAVLFGAIGHPKYDNDPTAAVRPEQGLLLMRKKLGYLLMSSYIHISF
jgi:3-isopropylmalate dehydrogenase